MFWVLDYVRRNTQPPKARRVEAAAGLEEAVGKSQPSQSADKTGK